MVRIVRPVPSVAEAGNRQVDRVAGRVRWLRMKVNTGTVARAAEFLLAAVGGCYLGAVFYVGTWVLFGSMGGRVILDPSQPGTVEIHVSEETGLVRNLLKVASIALFCAAAAWADYCYQKRRLSR